MLTAILDLYFFAAVLFLVFFCAYALAKGRSSLVLLFALLTFSMAVYAFGYAMELNSVELRRMEFWNMVQYCALPFYPALWLLLSLASTKALRSVSAATVYPFFIVPTLTFLFRLTNGMHGLYYSSLSVLHNGYFPVLVLGKGPWYYVNASYLLLCFLFALYFYRRRSRHLSRERRISFLMLTSGALMPLIGLALILLDFGGLGLDYAAILMPLSLLFIWAALFRYDFLAIKSLARDIVFETSNEAMILIDDSGVLTDCNLQAQSLFPELAAAAAGTSLAGLLSGRGDFLNLLTRASGGGAIDQVYQADSGRLYRLKAPGIRNKFGNTVGLLIGLTDCTEEREAHARLLERATVDGLTGLLNRAAFTARGEAEFLRAKASGESFALIMIDLDHFKVINDSLGHAAGDLALQFLGSELRLCFRASDAAARIGGEEFAVLLPGASADAAYAAAEQLRQRVADSPLSIDGNTFSVTFSAGVEECSSACESFSGTMRAADLALYEAKRTGRNRTVRAVPLR